MKLRELIERLEWVEQAIKGTPHPNTDNVEFHIHFGDADIDNRNWNIEIQGINFNNRPGCGCEENAVIFLSVLES